MSYGDGFVVMSFPYHPVNKQGNGDIHEERYVRRV